jgi:hypothetical protein
LLPGLRRGQYSTIAYLAQLDAVDGGTFRYVWSPSFEVLRVRPVSDVSARPLDVCFARWNRFLEPYSRFPCSKHALKPGIGYAPIVAQRFGDIGPTPAMGQGFGPGFRSQDRAGTKSGARISRVILLDRCSGTNRSEAKEIIIMVF